MYILEVNDYAVHTYNKCHLRTYNVQGRGDYN